MNFFPAKIIFLALTLFFVFSCKEKLKPKLPSNFDKNHFSTLINEIKNDSLDLKIRFAKADSALLLSENSNQDSIKFLALKSKLKLLSDSDRNKEAARLNQEILNWTNSLDDRSYFADINFNYGNILYNNVKNNDSAYYYLNHAKSEFIKLNDSIGIAKSSLNVAVILNDVGYYSESEDMAMEALKHLMYEPNHPYLVPIYNLLAISSGNLLNYEEELYWYNKALPLTEDPYYKSSLNNNKAVAYTVLKKYDEAIKILEEIKDDEILNKEPNLKARVIDNLAYAKWLKNPESKVLEEFNEALSIRENVDDKSGIITSLGHLSKYYANIDRKKAIDYAEKMYSLSLEIKNIEERKDALKRLIDLKDGANENEIDEYISLNDSIQEEFSKTKYKFAKIKYDAEENREKITKLSLEKIENDLELQRVKITMVIAVASLFIAGAIFFLYLYFLRERRKQERLAAIYETEVSLSQKLHDELANDLFNTITLVESIPFDDKSTKEKLIHNLDYIYTQTRSISRQNNTIDTKNFASELISMLSIYKSDQINVIINGIEDIAWEKLQNQIKIVIYRVLMEFMTNMKKHSDCSLVVIKMRIENDHLYVDYIDNGNVELLDLNSKKNGIRNMENRIEGLEGTIKFDLSNGFKAFIVLPI
jgi:tetratricopeptide (TPR) repeat protein